MRGSTVRSNAWSATHSEQEAHDCREGEGATQEQILAQYPQLTQDGLAATFRYAADVLKGEHVWDLKTTA